MKAIVSQPRYLPALNYLQRLYAADVFVILDCVQRQSRGWENRNKIILHGSEKWLTIPISGSSRERIDQAQVAGSDWLHEHKAILLDAYKSAPYFRKEFIDQYYSGIEELLGSSGAGFRDISVQTINNCCRIFEFSPSLVLASDIDGIEDVFGVDKIKKICEFLRVDEYVSGPNGKGYGIIPCFSDSAVKVLFHTFNHPVYPQHGVKSFVPYACFFDMLFNAGHEKVCELIRSPMTLNETT